jgi:hypothetical protein
MIKAIGISDQGRVLFFGLSELNITRLKEGKPIAIELSELGLKDEGLVVIAYGKTEADIEAEINKSGIQITNAQDLEDT